MAQRTRLQSCVIRFRSGFRNVLKLYEGIWIDGLFSVFGYVTGLHMRFQLWMREVDERTIDIKCTGQQRARTAAF